ncbi:ClpP/crotonase-like domain-containing protein [Umbelopsis sp. PMI_123]|nr:ClpP/crotonase-like domain-containing protein [Umbelopsis sp. PMI_123]
MAQQDEILLTVDKHVATITLNRPKRGNALTAKLNTQLFSSLQKVEADDNIRILILTGAGKYFCTGMDLGGGGPNQSPDIAVEKGMELFDYIYRFPKPVIARINGPALGGGVGFVFACNIRIATKSSYIALTEVKRGLIPAMISQYIVPEVGQFKANEYMLTGRRVYAQECLQQNCFSVVVEEDQLDQAVQRYVDMFEESAPGAMRDIKELVRVVGGKGTSDIKSQQDHIKKAFVKMMNSPEAAYGIMSFTQKKKPDWNDFIKSSKL